MNKLLFYFFFSLIISFSNSLFSQNPNDIPKIFPASPEASSLGRFGEIPVNLSIGMANFSVPVYTIEEDGFQLPISLGYQHNGLVVDQIPGHLGMGWNLNAGGMLTRQMRGRPDEDNAGYIGPGRTGKNLVVPYINNRLSPEAKNEVHLSASDNAIDLQPDKFIASVGNMSVTFYFDENRNPVIKPYKPYKIQIVNNDFSFNQGFKITDDQGVQYYFQDIETTKRTLPIPLGELGSAMTGGYKSGWKLSKIILTNNKEILFNYEGTEHHQSIKYQSFRQRISGDPNCNSSATSTSTRYYTINSKLIKNIVFPKGKIVFDNTIVSTYIENKYLSHLDKVSVINKNNQVVNTFNLNFDNLNKTRKLLKNVRVNNDHKNTYTFDYYGSPPDEILFYQQDFWGYYNNNTTKFLVNSFESYDIYGGRHPHFERTRLGALKKITYPTKGSTELEYEINTVDAENAADIPSSCQGSELNLKTSSRIAYNWTDTTTGSKIDQSEEFTIEAGFQYVYLHLLTEKISQSNNGSFGVYGKATARLEKVNGETVGCPDIECYDGPNGEGCDYASISLGGPIHNSPGKQERKRHYKLKPGTYRLVTEVENRVGGYEYGDIMVADAKILTQPQSEPEVSYETGGLRISKMKNCPSNTNSGIGLNCVEKEFKYEDQNNISYGKLFRKRNITDYELTVSEKPFINVICTATFKMYSSSSNVPLGYFTGSHIFYDTVIERTKGSDGDYLGSIKKTFVCSPVEQNLTFPFLDVDNKEFKNGKPLTEKVYNNIFVHPISEKKYIYDFDGNGTPLRGINQRVYSLAIGVYYDNNADNGPDGYKSNHTIFRNDTDREWLTKITTKEKLGNGTIETETSNIYNNPQGHIQFESITDSKGERKHKSFVYPYSQAPSAINTKLINKNRIGSPITTGTIKGLTTLNAQSIDYRDWGNGIIEPEHINTIKRNFSDTEERLQYHKYDTSNGTPLEVSKSNGSHLVYIWGYNKEYPIAKIENAMYSQVQNYVANIQAKSNADSDRTIGNVGYEGQLRLALEALRTALPKAQVSSYTYDPLIGVTSMTDPRGYTMYYYYDDFNRLQYVKDADGNILNQNEYNYAPQN